MTTFSRNPNPAITVFPTHKLTPINRKIYSGFLEHLGRCIYTGIYDPSNPNKSLIDHRGFRTDVLAALKPLDIPVMRYPGGNFCATYHWKDGIGPRDLRPARCDLAWGNVETNHFGTDEFMEWVRELGAEPFLCLNFGTGDLDEALHWLEYCNGTEDTYWANQRRKNGHPEPYNVKYWGLGNEVWGPWQINQMKKEDYAERAIQWAKAFKLQDPNVELILCGKEGATGWDMHVIKECVLPQVKNGLGEEALNLVDMVSIHGYTASEEHYENATAPLGNERAIEVCTSLIDLAFAENELLVGQKKPKICFDEWNVWSWERAPGSKGGEETYTLSDALAVATWLNVLVRQSAHVEMACIAQSVNVISPLMTNIGGITKQTTWWPYELFCKFMRGHLVAVNLACDVYEGPTKPVWIRAVRETPFMDVSATLDEEGWITTCVVNYHLEKEMETVFSGAEGVVSVYSITGEHHHVTNMEGKQEVEVKEAEWDSSKGVFVFPKCSITFLRWRTV
ncbi:alpha-L-arabinofuranosidase [Aspergillus insuetus]